MRGLVLFLLILNGVAWGDSGVLLPRDQDHPDASILSLAEMTVRVTIDNGDARVFITQIFANHKARIEEGTYVFALPTGSTVSDFATWDGPVRIPAVILERKRAEEVYDQARMQAIDPGLLEAGDRDSDAKSASTFTAKIVPIPAYGTKRVEIEYHQRLETNALRQAFVLPLQPTSYAKQSAAKFRLDLEIDSDEPMDGFAEGSKLYPLKVTRQDAHVVVASVEGINVSFDEDFSAGWRLDPAATDKLAVTTFRNPRHPPPGVDEMAPKKPAEEPGFFLAQTIVGEPKVAAASGIKTPRNVVVLFDTSLSMQWDKLERSYAALEKVLLSLTPTDHFNVVLFNQDVAVFSPQPVAAEAAKVQEALAFVKASRLRGGTDIGKALTAGLAQASLPDSSLILLTDGGSDRGTTVVGRKIAAQYAKEWKASSQHPRTHVFAVGDDADIPLLKQIAAASAKEDAGVMESVLSTEPVEPKLSLFLSHIVTRPVAGLSFDVEPRAAVKAIYPLGGAPYAGSIAAWVGDYAVPSKDVGFSLSTGAKMRVELPVEALGHPQLPRLWAQARVNALLDAIARDGETREAVDEIIELSRKYKFVTPYTSFLAAPRSLLRPRVIRPGDPVLRVHTDPSITSVIALFPFGLTKSLRHLASEDKVAGHSKKDDADRLWETRFLAPTDMKDGTYTVRLILRDASGRTYSEAKTFVIASTAPTVRIAMERTRYRRGELMLVKAQATASTRTLTARLQGAPALDLRWNPSANASTGQMRVPETLAPGVYTLSVTAEDVAHNMGSREVQLEIVP
jgi:Ca-activated chloride channel family protein